MKTPKETKILVVDDEAGLRKAIAFEFERKGYQVVTAENGLVAQNILQKNDVDVVISDIRMPGGDGIELLKWIKIHQSQTPCVIFITAFADLTNEDAYDLGAEAIFSKPFDRKGLRDAVLRCLTPRPERWKKDELEISTAPAVAIEWPDEVQSQSSLNPVVNLGKGGMFVGCPGPFPAPGTRVRFSLHIPALMGASLSEIQGEGIVRWNRLTASNGRPVGCGIEFLTLSDKCRSTIADCIEKCTKVAAFIPAA